MQTQREGMSEYSSCHNSADDSTCLLFQRYDSRRAGREYSMVGVIVGEILPTICNKHTILAMTRQQRSVKRVEPEVTSWTKSANCAQSRVLLFEDPTRMAARVLAQRLYFPQIY